MASKIEKIGVGIVHRLRKPVNPASILFFGFFTFLWGAWVATPFWDAFNQSAIFSALNYFGPEWVWGIIAIFCGVTMLYETLRPRTHRVCRGAFTGFLHWLIIGLGFLLGDWQNSGWILCAMISTICGYIYLNVKLNQVD